MNGHIKIFIDQAIVQANDRNCGLLQFNPSPEEIKMQAFLTARDIAVELDLDEEQAKQVAKMVWERLARATRAYSTEFRDMILAELA